MGGPRKLGGERRGVGTSLKVGMRSDRANYLKTGLKLVPTRVRYGVKMTPQGPLIVQFGPLSLALHPRVLRFTCWWLVFMNRVSILYLPSVWVWWWGSGFRTRGKKVGWEVYG